MNAVVQFQAPRLPYHPVVEERFGIDKSGWKALVEAIFPAAESIDSVVMALAYCKARNLDVFKRPVHIVPVYDSKRRCMVETVWPGISELRTTAMRTGSYAGCDDMACGPDVERDLDGVRMVFPEWGQITVYKLMGSARVPFVGPKVWWLETYATAKRDTAAPNTMWRKRPRGQLEKCAEAAALRRAYPEELGNEYAAEEMAGRVIGIDGLPAPAGFTAIPKTPAPRLHAGFDEPTETRHDLSTGEIIEAEVDEPPAEEVCDFPGDKPSTARASPGEAPEPQPGANGGSLFDRPRQDPEDWAVEQNHLLDDAQTVAEVDALTSAPDAREMFAALRAKAPGMAKSLDAAVTGKRKALADRERQG